MCMQHDEHAACELKKRVDQLDGRLTTVESSVAEMRNESRQGFIQVTAAVNALGHDFGARMTAIDTRLNEDKIAWGATLRKLVNIASAVILGIAAAAGGVNIYKLILSIH